MLVQFNSSLLEGVGANSTAIVTFALHVVFRGWDWVRFLTCSRLDLCLGISSLGSKGIGHRLC